MSYVHVPLLKKPANDDKNYIRKQSGGYAVTCKGSPTDPYLDVFSNCVGEACATYNKRWQEIMGMSPQVHTLLLNCNAENFIERAKSIGLEVEDEPSLGAIICWRKGNIGDGSDGAGHVATVEVLVNWDKTKPLEGQITFAESAYGGADFYTKTRSNKNGNWGMNPPYYFRGFIPLPYRSRIEPVEEDIFSNQVFVPEFDNSYLRVRTQPNCDSVVVDKCKAKSYYNVLEVVKGGTWTSGGQTGDTWYKIGDYYVAGVPGTVYKPKIEYSKPVPVKKDSKVDQLYVNVDSLHIRLSATTASKIMDMCDKGYYSKFEEVEGDEFNVGDGTKSKVWYKIGDYSYIAKVQGVSIIGKGDNVDLKAELARKQKAIDEAYAILAKEISR